MSSLSSSLSERGADLAEVVRRDVGRHADGDAGGAVDEQVGHPRRQHDRLGLGAVVVGPERHRGLLDLRQHLVADRRQPALGVPHGGGAVAVERSEVARAVDQRIAQRERLRHAHQRLVERDVAVRVEAAHHVADDLRALAVLDVGGQALLPHRVEDAALDRLQPVAHVGQGAGGDDRQRVVEVARLRRLVQRHRVGRAGAVAAAADQGRRPGRRASRRTRRGSAGSGASMLSKSDCSGGLRFAMVVSNVPSRGVDATKEGRGDRSPRPSVQTSTQTGVQHFSTGTAGTEHSCTRRTT